MAKTKKPVSVPIADVHTPDELLSGAELLLRSAEPSAMRAVVLEAVTALEVFVHRTVFGILPTKMDHLLVKWLEEKTRTDFDSRLSVLAPVATDCVIAKESALWDAYKKIRHIRHHVVHAGQRVTRKDAEFVVRTVYDWLAFLGSHLDVDLSLLALKEHIERSGIAVRSGQEANNIVAGYYKATVPALVGSDISSQKDGLERVADLVLKFGESTVVIETKLISGQNASLSSLVDSAIVQTQEMVHEFDATRGAIILFFSAVVPAAYLKLWKSPDGRVSVVGIAGTGDGGH